MTRKWKGLSTLFKDSRQGYEQGLRREEGSMAVKNGKFSVKPLYNFLRPERTKKFPTRVL